MAAHDEDENVSVDSQSDTATLPTKDVPEKSPYDFDDPDLIDDETLYDEGTDEDAVSEGSVDEGDPDEDDDESDAEEADDPASEDEETAEEADDSPEATSEEEELDLNFLDLDPEVYDDQIVNAMKGVKGLVGDLKGELNEAKKALGVFKAREAEAQAEQFFNEFDRQVDTLEIPDLGAGQRSALNKDQMMARKELLDEMNVIQQGRAANDLKPLPMDALVKRAVGALGLAPAKKRKGTRLSRPGRKANVDSDLSPEQKAVRATASKLREYSTMDGEDTFE